MKNVGIDIARSVLFVINVAGVILLYAHIKSLATRQSEADVLREDSPGQDRTDCLKTFAELVGPLLVFDP